MIKDLLTHTYIKNIKKWLYCPNCNNDKNKLRISDDNQLWICDKCGYTLSVEEFENDYIFWFCDNCNAFLNVQNGFTEKEETWLCEKCGFLNYTGKDNILGICKYCGIDLENPDLTICLNCRDEQYDKWMRKLNQVPQVLDSISVVVESVDRLQKDISKLREK